MRDVTTVHDDEILLDDLQFKNYDLYVGVTLLYENDSVELL